MLQNGSSSVLKHQSVSGLCIVLKYPPGICIHGFVSLPPASKSKTLYLGLDEIIHVYIKFREPFVKVLRDNKIRYYDSDGELLPSLLSGKQLLIISGEVQDIKTLVPLITDIYNDDLLNALIGGIYCDSDKVYVLSSEICDLGIKIGDDEHTTPFHDPDTMETNVKGIAPFFSHVVAPRVLELLKRLFFASAQTGVWARRQMSCNVVK